MTLGQRVFSAILALGFFGVFAPAAQAEAVKYIIEKPHSQVVFKVNHLGFSHSIGKFLKFDGTVTFDQAQPAASATEVTIDTASIELNDQKWNDHMKSADFFNVEKFPAMTFKSTGIEVTGEKTANIKGDLTILGVTRPVVLATTFNQAGKHPMSGKNGVGFSAVTAIKRSDFGMNYGLPMVGDDVEIMIEVEAYEDDPTAQGPGNP